MRGKPTWPPASHLVLVASAAAWGVLLIERAGPGAESVFCGSTITRGGYVRAGLGHWLWMVVAMMLPLTLPALDFLRVRSLSARRPQVLSLFVLGNALVWLATWLPISVWAAAQMGAWRTGGPWAGLLLAMVWQCTPLKQRALNACHRQPTLSVFGAPALRDACIYGVRHGLACMGACWAGMLLTLLCGQGEWICMAAVTLFACGERLEPPGPERWGWRGPARAMRMLRWRLAGLWPPQRNMACGQDGASAAPEPSPEPGPDHAGAMR